MDSSATLGARSKEDVALDLLKFVANTTNYGRPTAQTPGFTGAATPKSDDQINQLLDLYARCLTAVEGKKA